MYICGFSDYTKIIGLLFYFRINSAHCIFYKLLELVFHKQSASVFQSYTKLALIHVLIQLYVMLHIFLHFLHNRSSIEKQTNFFLFLKAKYIETVSKLCQ